VDSEPGLILNHLENQWARHSYALCNCLHRCYPIPQADVDEIFALSDYDFSYSVEGFSKLDNQGQLTIPGVFMHNYFSHQVGGAALTLP